MMKFYLPLLLAVCSGSLYQICSKSAPKGMDPLASLTISYFLAAILSGILYYCTHKGGNLLKEYASINWTAFAIGLLIVGIDAGNRYMYRVGWNASTVCVVNNGLIAVIMLLVGWLVFKENITWQKLAGAALCLAGIFLLSKA